MKNVVRSLIIANVVVFALQQVPGLGNWLELKFSLWPVGSYRFSDVPFPVGFEPWQLVTSAFLHGGVAHIAFNMFGLWSFGRVVEQAIGSVRFTSLYFASVLTSGLLQLLVVSMSSSPIPAQTYGASGGVFGVLLAFGMLFPHARVMLIFPPIPMKAWFMVIAFTVIELVSGVTGTMQGVAHFAHLGGMLGALILMLIWRRRLPPPPPA